MKKYIIAIFISVFCAAYSFSQESNPTIGIYSLGITHFDTHHAFTMSMTDVSTPLLMGLEFSTFLENGCPAGILNYKMGLGFANRNMMAGANIGIGPCLATATHISNWDLDFVLTPQVELMFYFIHARAGKILRYSSFKSHESYPFVSVGLSIREIIF